MSQTALPEAEVSDPGVDPRIARHGGLSYLEIPAIDPRASAAFYEHLLGWTIEWRTVDDPRFGDATGHLIGRWVTGRAIAREPGMLPYLYVESLDGAIEQVTAFGGQLIRDPYPEGNLRIATVRDPAGNVLGLWQQTSR